jgi:TfoX/Sxy family transcriptional regulator of competence genes
MPIKLTGLEATADEVISTWPDVRSRNVFGHRGYVRDGSMFAFIAEGGLAFKVRDEAAATELFESGSAVPFCYRRDMVMRGWAVMALGGDEELSAALSAASEAYERAGSA